MTTRTSRHQADDDDNPYDHNGILKDGRTAHVTFRDAVRARGATASPPRFVDSARQVGTRPGFIVSDDGERIRWEAYCDSVRDMADAWKTDTPPVGAYPLSSGEGTACTVNGAPGVLRKTADGKWLTCEPTRADAAPRDPRQPVSFADAQAIRDRAYAESVRELANAWRTP
jgi:hypothetical protein